MSGMLCFTITSSVHAAASKSSHINQQTLHSTVKAVQRQHGAPAAHYISFAAVDLQGHINLCVRQRLNTAMVCRIGSVTCNTGPSKILWLPASRKRLCCSKLKKLQLLGSMLLSSRNLSMGVNSNRLRSWPSMTAW